MHCIQYIYAYHFMHRLNILFSKNIILCFLFYWFCSVYFVLCILHFISSKHSLNVSCSLHSILCIMLNATILCTFFLCPFSHSSRISGPYGPSIIALPEGWPALLTGGFASLNHSSNDSLWLPMICNLQICLVAQINNVMELQTWTPLLCAES
jgi:hypothetical protein